MLEKIPDKFNTVSAWMSFLESLYDEKIISNKEANESLRLVHGVVKSRYFNILNK